ncbi:MAG: type IV pilus biogenesis protein EbsA [Microcoleaceae cyanobacterium]
MSESSAAVIAQLKAADRREVGVYLPYYDEKLRKYIPHSISLYKEKNLEGAREIDGGEDIPFVATWSVSSLPADLTHCRVQFDGNADLNYAVTLQNYEFLRYLIEVLQNFGRNRVIDFSQEFYKKLLQVD